MVVAYLRGPYSIVADDAVRALGRQGPPGGPTRGRATEEAQQLGAAEAPWITVPEPCCNRLMVSWVMRRLHWRVTAAEESTSVASLPRSWRRRSDRGLRKPTTSRWRGRATVLRAVTALRSSGPARGGGVRPGELEERLQLSADVVDGIGSRIPGPSGLNLSSRARASGSGYVGAHLTERTSRTNGK